ncbi:LGFP repeat-containing protein [Leifsonia sp. NPDC058194]|uniref:LGFP repeat-containing protein n=1 Tax=Leifsonia sp. NPDC058194 TaxID=3346374 RepID=UPI0036D87516
MRSLIRSLGFVLVLVLAVGALQFAAPARTEAANAFDFNPSNIISDDVFYNPNTMNEASVQAFLNAIVPNCSAGYTCLKNFSQTTTSRGGDAMCGPYAGAPNEPAARIIVKVAQACGINPQVILATLQKEQALVTSTAPSAWAWKASMGYACPDTAACDTQYYGFYNQVYSGSWQFKRYGNPPGTSNFFTWYPVGGYANVLYNPDSSCGSSRVYISNKATAALYYYTPYQPNNNALAAGYGASSDRCASYGNRNFFMYFTDWFGSTGNAGPSFIDALYNSTGGAGGPLGDPATGYITLSDNGGGMVRGYAGGAIAWTKAYGAFIISNPIRDYFNANGGIGGSLGWPTSNANTAGAGLVQGFQGGAITYTSATGPRVLSGALRTAYNATGGLSGPLGWPSGDASCSGSTCKQSFEQATLSTSGGSYTIASAKIAAAYTAAGGASGALGAAVGVTTANLASGTGLIQAYANGVITSTSTGGAHSLSGSIRSMFNALGGLSSYLGWPTGDMACDASNTCSQAFQGGTIYADKNGSSSAISAEILALYNSMGGASGSLGAPVGTTISFTGGLVQGFANGAIAWTPGAGAYALTGDIRAAYNALGGVTGGFGWPVTAANAFPQNGGGLVQGFQNGVILATTASGAYPLSGDIRAAYNAAGGIPGPVGWPLTSPISTNGGLVQAFQNAAITYTSGAGAHVLSGAFRTAYATVGGIGGSIGWPTSDVTAVGYAGGGSVQGFEKGAVTQKTGGDAIVLLGPIRDYFNAQGGLASSLGWPAKSLACNATGTACQQTFDGGTVSWTAAGGATLVK